MASETRGSCAMLRIFGDRSDAVNNTAKSSEKYRTGVASGPSSPAVARTHMLVDDNRLRIRSSSALASRTPVGTSPLSHGLVSGIGSAVGAQGELQTLGGGDHLEGIVDGQFGHAPCDVVDHVVVVCRVVMEQHEVLRPGLAGDFDCVLGG